MALSIGEIINKLEQYDGNKQVRVLFGLPTPILWLSHEDKMFDGWDYTEGCTIYTSDDIEIRELDRIETVSDLLWHLQFFKKDGLVCNCDLDSCNSYIEEVTDEVTDAEGNIVDTVFLIPFAHIVG